MRNSFQRRATGIGFAAVAQDFGARGVAQANGCRPVAAHGPDRRGHGHGHRAAARKPLVGAQDRARAGERHRHQRQSGLDRGRERTEMKRAQTRRARERAFGEEDQGLAGERRARQAARVLDAAQRLETLHELGADVAQKQARHQARGEFALGDEAETPGSAAVSTMPSM